MRNATSQRPGRVLDPAKRAAILDGARAVFMRAVFMREGFAQGSMDAVAAEAGVGKQTIYRHFGSKEALVEALVEAMCAPEVLQPLRSSLPAPERLRELLLTFAAGVAGPDSVRLYRAIVAEADRMPGLGRLFWEAGPRQVRAVIAQLWAEDHDAATAPIVAEQLVQLALGDAYQELVLGTGSPAPEIFERQIDAALALLGPTSRRPRHAHRGRRIELLRHRHQGRIVGVGDIDDLGEIRERPRQPVDLVDDYDLNLAALNVLQQPVQGRALHGAAGLAAVVIHVRKRAPSGVTLAHDIDLASLALGVERIKLLLEPIIGRLPGIDRAADGGRGSCGISPRHRSPATAGDSVSRRRRPKLYDDHLDCWLGSTLVLTLRRGRPNGNLRGHVINYRHVIHALKQKPMALFGLAYRDQIFPRPAYARAFDALTPKNDPFHYPAGTPVDRDEGNADRLASGGPGATGGGGRSLGNPANSEA